MARERAAGRPDPSSWVVAQPKGDMGTLGECLVMPKAAK
jgi:hypothetical protein